MKKSDSDKTGRGVALGENYSDNVKLLTELLRSEQSFDMLTKTLTLSDGELTLFFIDGFAKDTVLQKLMMHFLSLKKHPRGAVEFMQGCLPYGSLMMRILPRSVRLSSGRGMYRLQEGLRQLFPYTGRQ